jgi:hypothetical protein
MHLIDYLLPLAAFIGFLGLAIGGKIAQIAVIVATILAGVDLLLQ